MRGVDVDAMHARVARLAHELHLPLLPRRDAFERDRGQFRDEVHLNAIGRAAYSRWLAEQLPPLLAR